MVCHLIGQQNQTGLYDSYQPFSFCPLYIIPVLQFMRPGALLGVLVKSRECYQKNQKNGRFWPQILRYSTASSRVWLLCTILIRSQWRVRPEGYRSQDIGFLGNSKWINCLFIVGGLTDHFGAAFVRINLVLPMAITIGAGKFEVVNITKSICFRDRKNYGWHW